MHIFLKPPIFIHTLICVSLWCVTAYVVANKQLHYVDVSKSTYCIKEKLYQYQKSRTDLPSLWNYYVGVMSPIICVAKPVEGCVAEGFSPAIYTMPIPITSQTMVCSVFIILCSRLSLSSLHRRVSSRCSVLPMALVRSNWSRYD